MRNRHGEFIWYELMTRDPDRAADFYHRVLGWTIGESMPGEVDYRILKAGEEGVGGMLGLTDEMCEHGARPVWLGYVGVDDVDACIEQLQSLGGSVLMPAQDIPDVGRIAMVADPEGVPFYIMRGASDEESRAFDPELHGHCCWNELSTGDQSTALSFYGTLFGWQSREAMPMGEMGEYRFLDLGDSRFGALSPKMSEDQPVGWVHYFHVPDIDACVARTRELGGTLMVEPHEIPGGDSIIIAGDPTGAMFALVGPRG